MSNQHKKVKSNTPKQLLVAKSGSMATKSPTMKMELSQVKEESKDEVEEEIKEGPEEESKS